MAQSNAEPPAHQTCAFPSSLPPQLVISWLPMRDISSALCASSVWHRASAAAFQFIAQSRGLGRERADVPWSEVVRCSKKRVTVVGPDHRYFPRDEADLAKEMGLLDQGWVARTPDPHVGDRGDFICWNERTLRTASNCDTILAFRADRDGAIHIMERKGVLIGYPGELGTVGLTAEDTKTLGLSDLKKELAARGHDWVFPPTERGYREFLIHKLY